MEDDFVIFPNNSNLSNITIDVSIRGVKTPGVVAKVAGNTAPPDQTPPWDTVEKDTSGRSWSIRDAPLGTVRGSLVANDPPGSIGDKPSNVVNSTQFP